MSQSVKNLVLAGGARMTGLLCTLAVSIYTARILGPQRLGVSSTFLPFISWVGFLITQNQDNNLIREYFRERETANRNLIVKSAFVQRTATSTIVSILWSIVVFTAIPPKWHLAAFSATLALIGTTLTPSWYLLASGRPKLVFGVHLLQQVLLLAFSLAFLTTESHAGMDLLLLGVSSIICALIGWAIAGPPKLTRTEILEAWKRPAKLSKSGGWMFATGLAILIYTNAEQPIIATALGIEELGIYRTSVQIAGALAALTVVFHSYYYPKLLVWVAAGPAELAIRQRSLITKTSLVVLPLLLTIAIFVPSFYNRLYGEPYSDGILPAILLVGAKGLVFLNGIYVSSLHARGYDKEIFVLVASVSAVSVLANIAVVPSFGLEGAAAINLASEGLVLIGARRIGDKIATFSNTELNRNDT